LRQISGNNRSAPFTATQSPFFEIQTKARSLVLRAVAFDAMTLKNRTDIADKIYLVHRVEIRL